MLSEKRLRAVLHEAPLVSFQGSVTRFVYEAFRYGAMPLGALKNGARYNPRGAAALYASFSRACALAEFTRYIPDERRMSAASMLSIDVRLNRALDLTDDAILRLLRTSKDELCSSRFPGDQHPASLLGFHAAKAGIDGLIVWSAVHDEEKNLVVFPDSHTTPPYVVVRSVRENAPP